MQVTLYVFGLGAEQSELNNQQQRLKQMLMLVGIQGSSLAPQGWAFIEGAE